MIEVNMYKLEASPISLFSTLRKDIMNTLKFRHNKKFMKKNAKYEADTSRISNSCLDFRYLLCDC